MGNREKQLKNASMPSDLKYLNRKRILDIIRNTTEVSVNDISEATKISRPTVKKAIQSFEEIGLLVSAGKGSSTNIGGKRPELYSFSCNKRILCISLEESYIHFAVLTMKNECILEIEIPATYNNTLDTFQKELAIHIEDILVNAEISHDELYGISFAIAGFVDQKYGIVRFFMMAPHWGRNINIKEWLEKLYPKQEIIVENLVRMAGNALLLEEEFRNKRTVVMYAEAGISSCYIDNVVLTGRNALIGEIGHMTVDYSDEEICSCGSKGCFERMVSAERIRHRLKKNSMKLLKSSINQWIESKDLIRHVFEEADNGDELSMIEVGYLAEMFSLMLKNVAINFDPEIVVLLGQYAYAGDYFKIKLKEERKKARFFPEETASVIYYDIRPLRELQKAGGYQVLTQKFFENPIFYEGNIKENED